MTDQTIPADKVRTWVNSWETTRPEHRTLEDAEGIIQALRDLLPPPPPPRPTMADMPYEERAACRWMQADIIGFRGKCLLVSPSDWDGDAVLLDREGEVHYENHAMVVPRPDLPRFEWPGEQKPAPALPDGWRLADHKDYGRVIVTTKNPDRHGYVAFVYRADFLNSGRGNDWCKPDELTYLDTHQEEA